MRKIKELIDREIAKNPEFEKEYKKEYLKLKLGVEVMTIRESKGMTQREFANLLGKKQPSVAKVETGKANVTIDTLQEYADALDKELDISFK